MFGIGGSSWLRIGLKACAPDCRSLLRYKGIATPELQHFSKSLPKGSCSSRGQQAHALRRFTQNGATEPVRGRYQHGTPQDTNLRNLVPKTDLMRYGK
jgi:hypothetical protein